MKINIKTLALALIGGAVIWAALMAFVPGAKQARLFYAEGREVLSDFVMPRQCAAAADPYEADAVGPQDRCYAALGYLVASAFPVDNYEGGVIFTLVGAVLFLLAAGLVVRARGGWMMLGAVALSSPFLFNLERANQVWLAGAGVMVFLAWFESECRWKRMTALAALAFAGALKITPGIFALLLVKNRRWKDLVVLSVFGLALLILPFFYYGGVESFLAWLGRMHEHMEFYSSLKSWGFVKLARTGLLRLTGIEMEPFSAVHRSAAGADMLMGLIAVGAFFKCKDRAHEVLLLACALVLAPGVSQYYTALYLMPAFLLMSGRKLSMVEVVLWFALLCPLQLPMGAMSLNRTIADVALIGLTVVTCRGEG